MVLMLVWRRDCTLTSRRSCFCHNCEVPGVDDNQTSSNTIYAQKLFLSSLHAAGLSKLLLSLSLSNSVKRALLARRRRRRNRKQVPSSPQVYQSINPSILQVGIQICGICFCLLLRMKNQRACLLAWRTNLSCNGTKESWRWKKSPLNATKHDQNMAFFRSIMQKYYRGGCGEHYAN